MWEYRTESNMFETYVTSARCKECGYVANNEAEQENHKCRKK